MKSKILFSVGTIGVLFMMAGQLSFSINDSYVKLVVKNIGDDNSLYSVIFLRGLVTSSPVSYTHLTLPTSDLV